MRRPSAKIFLVLCVSAVYLAFPNVVSIPIARAEAGAAQQAIEKSGVTEEARVVVQGPFGLGLGRPAESAPESTPEAQVEATAEPEQSPPEGTVDAAPEREEVPLEQAEAEQSEAEDEDEDDDDAPISLILDNADIYQVIRIIGDALDLNYVVDPAVQGTVNISTSDTLRTSDLLPLLETILKINGATLIQTGNFYQIVPSNTAVREPLPIQDNISVQSGPDDRIVIQVVRMRYVVAAEMARLLTPYLSEAGNVVVHESGNILLVSERRGNLRKLMEIVDIFDTGAFEGERVRMFPVENAFAGDLIQDLRSIFAGYALSGEATAIRFVPIDRLNSILVVTPNSSVFPEVEQWLARLDLPLQSGGIQNFVYRVKNSKAEDLQRVLTQLYGRSGVPSPIPAATVGGAQQIVTAQDLVGGVPALSNVDPVLANQNLRIIADSVTNSLVIQGTAQEYAEIERTLGQLDILPRQVLIDAQIYEVVLDDSLSFGVTATLQSRGTLAEPLTTAAFATAGSGPASISAQTFAFVGRTRELVTFLNASENRSRVRTVSAPSVLVSDNMQANFQVGAEVPVPTSSAVNPAASNDIFAFAQTIQFRTTGVIMSVLPQITESGRIALQISQEVSQAGSNTTSGIVAPVIGKSSVDSTIVVQDGQTIALGGFIRESNELVRNRVPLIGRVPILGGLFGNTSRSTNRTELIVLITPHVIRDTEEADQATAELKERLKEIQEIIQ